MNGYLINCIAHRLSVAKIGREPLVDLAVTCILADVSAFAVSGWLSIDTGLVFLDVTTNFDGIIGVATVRVDPVHT